MSNLARRLGTRSRQLWTWFIIGMILLAAGYVGLKPSRRWLVILAGSLGTFLLLQQLNLGLLALIVAALVVRIPITTGTEVELNVATVLIPALFILWLVDSLRRGELRWAASSADRPLVLFLLAGLFSLLLGNVLWDPSVPKSEAFWLVQLAQWGIFAFAAMAFWLLANLREAETWLPRLIWAFLLLGGGLAILRLLPGLGGIARRLTTVTFIRAPFWVLLFAAAGGQLLFNQKLDRNQQGFLVAVVMSVFVYAFVDQREAASNWVGIAAVLGVLFWMRFPKLQGAIVTAAIVLTAMGVLFPTLYEFAGGEDEWILSGGSRLALIERVVQVTMRNPITGLGPASYRNYANAEPLKYRNALWMNPKVNSHNNYVDLFAHTGLLGLGLFLWFMGELGWLGWTLSRRYTSGFLGGYVNGMFAAWAGSLVLMMLADWMLPFVYNIGFPGFQASLLVWLFLGGLVAVENLSIEIASDHDKFSKNSKNDH